MKYVETVQNNSSSNNITLRLNNNQRLNHGYAANQIKERMDKLVDRLPAILELAWAITLRHIIRTSHP
jgi:hypothetical protein